MRITISESQYNRIILESQYELVLTESLYTAHNYNDKVSKLKKAILTGLSLATILSAITKSSIPQQEKDELTTLTEYMYEQLQQEHKNDSIRKLKIDACKDYIQYALSNKDFDIKNLKVSPEEFVRVSEINNFDLPLLLAAAHQESCFGMTNRARLTNSIFSQGAYDDGTNKIKYKTQNESIQGYVNLLRKDYLVRNKTITDLLKDNSFVNFDGKRYASDPDYEKKIRMLRNNIIRKYPILTK